MSERKTYNLLVLIYLSKDSAMPRIQEDLPQVIETLARASKEAPHVAFRSTDAIVSGFLIQTHKAPQFIGHDLDRCQGLNSRDSYFVMELGAEFMGFGEFTRAHTWLQHHKSQ
ncbi:hypothetical protein [Henriciella sp.]|uniref:hypothetical protein n=1 Tax=Henriciella sp. TaxID=1968823 RepID=UPI000C10D7FB|nr:hypothetical protein [Henriciella sp.]PHR83088.1 MAG: hypothetical protein COA64_00080 [Henriciella sp.]|tara:strand:- start:478 stop:816 length:339 start_codon:yes stop_codon:yes gene_type:complete